MWIRPLSLALVLLAAPASGATDGEHRAELLVAAGLRARAVRPVPESALREDAARIVAALTPERRSALLAGTLSPEDVVGSPALAGPPSTDLRSLAGKALGDADSDLLFVPIAPCRIIDTRLGGGLLAANTDRAFLVAGGGLGSQGGEAGGCGIPLGNASPVAPAVAINFIAVGPLGPGNLRAWEFGQPAPNASVVNYSNVGGLNIANGVIVPITGVSTQLNDLTIRADVSGTHVVADVTGYFTRFPIERVKSTLVSSALVTPVNLSDGACHEIISCNVTAPTNGQVLVIASGEVFIRHDPGTADRADWAVESGSPAVCPCATDSFSCVRVYFPADDQFQTVPSFAALNVNFPIAAGASVTYRVSAKMASGAGALDSIPSARMSCLFVPD